MRRHVDEKGGNERLYLARMTRQCAEWVLCAARGVTKEEQGRRTDGQRWCARVPEYGGNSVTRCCVRAHVSLGGADWCCARFFSTHGAARAIRCEAGTSDRPRRDDMFHNLGRNSTAVDCVDSSMTTLAHGCMSIRASVDRQTRCHGITSVPFVLNVLIKLSRAK
jgi:hypothetical protein